VKLSESQLNVLRLLNNGEGWEIGLYTGINPRARMQKGGLGKGGEAQDVRITTFTALSDKGLIARNKEAPFAFPQHWHITSEGKAKVFTL
jgi:hypothetical protein